MRMRKKPWAEEEIAQSSYTVGDAAAHFGKWSDLFGNENPLHVEIGMGKGRFIIGKAKNHPNVNFVGIERQLSVLAAASRQMRKDDDRLPNVRIVYFDAQALTDLFAENEVSHIYINFCDPWPKKRNEKRRLTHECYLSSYERVLESGGGLTFKTDNDALFRFSVNELAKCGWVLKRAAKTSSGDSAQSVISEYEQRFASLGMEIYEINALPPKSKILQSIPNVL